MSTFQLEQKTLQLYITLDNGKLHGANSFTDDEQILFKHAISEVNTKQGIFILDKDIGQVVPREISRNITNWGKYEAAGRPLPVRYLEYRLVQDPKIILKSNELQQEV